ncbi:PQQ-binding-like beta-propeller repeat protein [Pseudoxanthobacter sp.]|uniref:PQQ-like beta-propeller repeat protein n=1 Tax=Pseudoxanthobacter sp. TaxID=1925742 RepID=UPI002FE33747
MSPKHLVRFALVSMLVFGVAGCETLSSLNPFEKKQPPLPGKRVDVFTADDVLQQAGAGTATIGGAQSNADWPVAGGTPANDSGSLAFAGSATRAWSTTVLGGSLGGGWFGAADSRVSARPVTGAGQVYVYAPNGAVTALSLANGGRAWQVSLRPEKERDPAIGGGVAFGEGRVYVGTGYGALVALDPASGKTLWTKDLASPARGAPTVSGGKVFIVSDQNVVYAVNAADGSEAWSYRGIPEAGGLLASASPAVSGNTLVAPYTSGEVMGFDIAKGEPQWSDAVTQSTRTMALSSLSDVAASPVIVGDTVYATGVSGRTIAINTKTGERRWDQNVGSAHTPVVSGNAVFLVDLDDRAAALDRNSGQPLWSVQLPVINTKSKRTHWAGPLLAGGQLWFVSSAGEMMTVDPAGGKLGPVRKIGDPAFMGPILANGTMIVVSGVGTITAYR